jgi:hypothetical protein
MATKYDDDHTSFKVGDLVRVTMIAETGRGNIGVITNGPNIYGSTVGVTFSDGASLKMPLEYVKKIR